MTVVVKMPDAPPEPPIGSSGEGASEADELATLRGYRIQRNADGSKIVRLEQPIVVGKDEVSRMSIPRLTGRHLRTAPWKIAGGGVTLAEIYQWAATIVQPEGALDECDPDIARDVAMEVFITLGKRLMPSTGEGK